MLGWSINLFRIFGIQLSVHWTFPAALVWYGFEGWKDGGAIGMVVSIGLVLTLFVCVVLHELGHSLTARRFGVQVPRILLSPIGGMAQFDRIPRQPKAELLITAAGPAVNFVIFGVLALACGLPKGLLFHPEFDDSLNGIGQGLLYWNLIMGLFNLLPVFPMDGGRVFRAILAMNFPYLKATFIASAVAKVLAILFAALAAYFLKSPNDYLMVALFAFIYFAGDAEYKMLRRREQEAAYWADMAKRLDFGPPRPTASEPPLLHHGPN